MNDKTIPHIMMDLTHKVDLITEKVVKNKNYYSNYKDESGYGIFIKNENKEDTLWFGIDYKFWKENEIPLTIGVYGDNDEYVNLLQNKYGDEIKEIEFEKDDFFYYLPLPLEIYKTTEKIENKIKEVKLLLGIE